MEYKDYVRLKEKIVPGLRFNQAIYEETVTAHVSERTVWLDAGCGHHIFPPWREDVERRFIREARLVVGCDLDQPSLRKHHTLGRLVATDLEALPFRTESMTLVTCNMVVEHLERPISVFAEFARVLAPGGRVILHTPNAYSHFVVASRFIPGRLKTWLAAALTGRDEADVFPTRYRANTPRKLRNMLERVGLKQEACRMLASDATLQCTHRFLVMLELLYIKLSLRPACRFLRYSMLANFVKPTNREQGVVTWTKA